MERRPRVLVVDDENVVCQSFDRVLSDEYAVDTAGNGIAALERIRQEPYDIAFVDLKMPAMDGMDLARRIRTQQPTMQIIIVTGYATPEKAREASELGVSDFLAKPLTPDAITTAAGQAWDKRRRILGCMESLEASVETPLAFATVDPASRTIATGARRKKEHTPPWMQTMGALMGGSLLGLAYVIFLPVIGIGMLGWLLIQKAAGSLRRAKAGQPS